MVETLTKRAEAAGYKLDKSLLKRLARQINSGDAKDFLKAMETIGRNKRLMQIFDGADLGTKPEQGE